MRSSFLVFAAVGAVFLSQYGLAANQADAIVRRADQARGPQKAFSARVDVKDTQDGETKTNVYRIHSKGVRFCLVEQLAPARLQGRKLLMHDRDLWLYTPNISRPTRISFEQKLTGEVSNGDLMRTNFAEDYSATILGEESLGGKPVYKLKLTAKSNEVTYRSIDYWVDKKTFFPVQAIFYALSGKALKTAAYSGFKSVLGKQRMTKVTVTDFFQKGHVSVMTYSNYKAENLDDSFFNKESLAD